MNEYTPNTFNEGTPGMPSLFPDEFYGQSYLGGQTYPPAPYPSASSLNQNVFLFPFSSGANMTNPITLQVRSMRTTL